MTFDYVHTVTGEVVPSEDFDHLERDEVQYQRRARRLSGGSVLGDRIIADGPFVAGGVFPEWMAAIKTAAEWNGLRDELIELRAQVAPPLGACVIEGHGGHPAWECKRRDAVPVDALRWQPGEWRGVAPDNQPGAPLVVGKGPMVYRKVTFTSDDQTPWRGCAPATTGGITARCPVCNWPMDPGMVECAGCAGVEDAAAKRQADQ